MSSVIFQPLLHDPLGWKPTRSTYVDHYKWRKYRATTKDKKVSAYGQQYQKRLQKQQQQLVNRNVPLTKNTEQIVNRVVVVKKDEDQQVPLTPTPYRCSSVKTPVYVVESKSRSASTNEEPTTSDSKASQRPPTALGTVQEKTRPFTALEVRPPSKEDKEKSFIDANNDNSRHWLTYPNPRTPQYILDVKQRLGQLKISSTLARPTSASSRKQTLEIVERPSSASIQQPPKSSNINDEHHFLSFNIRDTPDDLRAARCRIDKHRYHPSLDNYPPRPQTCPIRSRETPKPLTPEETQTIVPVTKTEAWTNDEEKKSIVPDYESSSILIQVVDCDGLPNEYVEALETANVAQEEYQRNLKFNVDRRTDNFVYRLPENTNQSHTTYHNQQSVSGMNNQLRQVARSSQNDFGTWVRNASDRERASAMKILHDVLNQPVTDDDQSMKVKTVFKQPPAPPPVRATSATRKLGRTRTQHRFPCEICEKLLIKRHVWDLSGSETLTCPHHPQGSQVKSS